MSRASIGAMAEAAHTTPAASPTPRRATGGVFRPLVMLIFLFSLVSVARSFNESSHEATSGAAMGAGLALLGGIFAGQLFGAIRLPRITGYLCVGMAAGPQGLKLITSRMLDDLVLVNGVAIGLIALTAGLELNFKKLRPRLATIGAMGGLGLAISIVVIGALNFAFASYLPHFDRDFDLGQRFAVALLTGTVYATVSPSVAFAILAETGSAGPVSEVALGLVVLGDIALVIIFAAVNAFAAGFFQSGAAERASLGGLMFEIFGSLGLGVGIGFLIALYVRRVAKKTALFAFGLCFLVAEMGARLHLDPLLACLAAGLTVENLTQVEGVELGHSLEIAAMPTFAVFFCVAGAGIHLREFAHVAPYAVGFALLRWATLFVGSRLGGALAHSPPVVKRYAPFALFPQAGIAIGLAILVARQFGGTDAHPAWGLRLKELVFGTIALNELIGPSILRWALGRAGEIGKREAVGADH